MYDFQATDLGDSVELCHYVQHMSGSLATIQVVIFFCSCCSSQDSMEFPKESLEPHETLLWYWMHSFGGHSWGDMSYCRDWVHVGKSKNEPQPSDSKLGFESFEHRNNHTHYFRFPKMGDPQVNLNWSHVDGRGYSGSPILGNCHFGLMVWIFS